MSSIENLVKQITYAVINDLKPSRPLKLESLPKTEGSMIPELPPGIVAVYTVNNTPLWIRVIEPGSENLQELIPAFSSGLIDHIKIIPMEDTKAAMILVGLFHDLFGIPLFTTGPRTGLAAEIDSLSGEPRRRGRPRTKPLPDPNAPKRRPGRPKRNP